MKTQKWNEPGENSTEIMGTSMVLKQEDIDISSTAPKAQKQVTELRRRIEERLDSKRIEFEYDWDDLDN
ncbi:MAG: hypothetical protein CMQ41_05720 [Gammaproteobacteria bacterium]|nr:hypothetical protein [Gammaproteobacteria bacterium]|tara:strand:- start:587 stop:793 length:207 start_codon:yes stop_codon:yes gene_type:complete